MSRKRIIVHPVAQDVNNPANDLYINQELTMIPTDLDPLKKEGDQRLRHIFLQNRQIIYLG
jgi:hypothetical protein